MMSIFLRSTLSVAVAGLLMGAEAAQAQTPNPRINPRRVAVIPAIPSYNPNYYLPNGMTVSQYANTVSTLGQAYSQVPPYLFGYNPYPSPIVNYGAGYPIYSPYVPGFVPMYGLGNPLMPGITYPNFYTNPLFSFLNNNP